MINGRDELDDINTLDDIAMGRVWTGGKGQNHKLVDEIGGINDAIVLTAKEAGITDIDNIHIIEYPKKELWTLAMVTGETFDNDNNQYYKLFVPTTPNPTSGFIILVPSEDVIELDMNVEEALRMIISLGVVVPEWDRQKITSSTQKQDF